MTLSEGLQTLGKICLNRGDTVKPQAVAAARFDQSFFVNRGDTVKPQPVAAARLDQSFFVNRGDTVKPQPVAAARFDELFCCKNVRADRAMLTMSCWIYSMVTFRYNYQIVIDSRINYQQLQLNSRNSVNNHFFHGKPSLLR